jgi:hypothetical protein
MNLTLNRKHLRRTKMRLLNHLLQQKMKTLKKRIQTYHIQLVNSLKRIINRNLSLNLKSLQNNRKKKPKQLLNLEKNNQK